MGEKGDRTRQVILEAANNLFAEYGFQKVTMKDICEKTGMSRGGLYRHYDSTAQIFMELFQKLSADSSNEMEAKIEKGFPAVEILNQALVLLEEEMIHSEQSLSLAIYEYAVGVDQTFFEELDRRGREKWECLLQYGIGRGEFKKENADAALDLLLYSYQGVRMWSRITKIRQKQIHEMLQLIRRIVEGK